MGEYCMQGEDVLCLPEETEGQRTKRKDQDLVIFAILYLNLHGDKLTHLLRSKMSHVHYFSYSSFRFS